MEGETLSALETLNVELDNVRLELQVLQVENVRLQESNPEVSAELDSERSEIEELQQRLHNTHECRIQVQQEKESLIAELVSVKQQLEETEQMLEAKTMVRVEGDNSLNHVQTEITELWNTIGRSQLELKCALNEKALCAYWLAEERHKAHVLSTGNCIVLINKVSLHSAENDGLTMSATVSTGIGLCLTDMLESRPTWEATRHMSV